MKKTYEAPEAKFIGFAPAENLASAAPWDWSAKFSDENTTETDSQIDVIIPGKNPEGDF